MRTRPGTQGATPRVTVCPWCGDRFEATTYPVARQMMYRHLEDDHPRRFHERS